MILASSSFTPALTKCCQRAFVVEGLLVILSDLEAGVDPTFELALFLGLNYCLPLGRQMLVLIHDPPVRF